jgi:hypothetical protein
MGGHQGDAWAPGHHPPAQIFFMNPLHNPRNTALHCCSTGA